ncbi:transposase [Sporosarcina sp. YIM B06819]|uniref:transposase n=1 Tax=Sporosarcina sp. YIM B06819 TaxID=3081769 RepID=UPI00298C235E|nr:transposase [Sporosarcina sp. YIM B06819]
MFSIYSRYPKGFYVNAEKNTKGAAKYIGRYLARPAIAEYRIEEYDGEMVKYWYGDHKTGKRVDVKQSACRFLYNILQYISPKKHFRMVGRFGLYGRMKHKKAKQVLTLYALVRTRQLSLLLEKKQKRKRITSA